MRSKTRRIPRRTVMVLAVIMGVVSTVPAARMTPEQAIAEANRAISAAYAAQDADTVASFYTEDALLLPPGAEAVRGREAIRAFTQQTMSDGLTGLELETTAVEMHGKSALEIGRWAGFNADGDRLGDGHYIVVWEREKGDWKLSRDIWTSDALPGE